MNQVNLLLILSGNYDFSSLFRYKYSSNFLAVLVIDIAALIMTTIMIYHIKSKYTAVGRKEMVMFFYLYMADVLLEFLLLSNIIASSSTVYKVFNFFNY